MTNMRLCDPYWANGRATHLQSLDEAFAIIKQTNNKQTPINQSDQLCRLSLIDRVRSFCHLVLLFRSSRQLFATSRSPIQLRSLSWIASIAGFASAVSALRILRSAWENQRGNFQALLWSSHQRSAFASILCVHIISNSLLFPPYFLKFPFSLSKLLPSYFCFLSLVLRSYFN